jgi:hypothetical protein
MTDANATQADHRPLSRKAQLYVQTVVNEVKANPLSGEWIGESRMLRASLGLAQVSLQTIRKWGLP